MLLIINVHVSFIDDIELHAYCEAYPHKLTDRRQVKCVCISGNGL